MQKSQFSQKYWVTLYAIQFILFSNNSKVYKYIPFDIQIVTQKGRNGRDMTGQDSVEFD